MLEFNKQDINPLYLHNCEFPEQSIQPTLLVLHVHQCCNFSLLSFWFCFGWFFVFPLFVCLGFLCVIIFVSCLILLLMFV